MIFKCNKNKFLEKVLNMKPLPIQTFIYYKNGKIVELTNHQILQDFLNEASPRELIQVQHILTKDTYSIKSINKFIKEAGYEILNRM